MIIFHSHHADRSGRIRYYMHGRANTLKQAVRSIKGYDSWQMNGRVFYGSCTYAILCEQNIDTYTAAVDRISTVL